VDAVDKILKPLLIDFLIKRANNGSVKGILGQKLERFYRYTMSQKESLVVVY